jgi:hypothetical protein
LQFCSHIYFTNGNPDVITNVRLNSLSLSLFLTFTIQRLQVGVKLAIQKLARRVKNQFPPHQSGRGQISENYYALVSKANEPIGFRPAWGVQKPPIAYIFQV